MCREEKSQSVAYRLARLWENSSTNRILGLSAKFVRPVLVCPQPLNRVEVDTVNFIALLVRELWGRAKLCWIVISSS